MKRERKNLNVLFVSMFCSWGRTKFVDERPAASCRPMTNSVIILCSRQEDCNVQIRSSSLLYPNGGNSKYVSSYLVHIATILHSKSF